MPGLLRAHIHAKASGDSSEWSAAAADAAAAQSSTGVEDDLQVRRHGAQIRAFVSRAITEDGVPMDPVQVP